jgi:hypothetical protein
VMVGVAAVFELIDRSSYSSLLLFLRGDDAHRHAWVALCERFGHQGLQLHVWHDAYVLCALLGSTLPVAHDDARVLDPDELQRSAVATNHPVELADELLSD